MFLSDWPLAYQAFKGTIAFFVKFETGLEI